MMKPVKGTRDFVGNTYKIYDFIRTEFKKHLQKYGFSGIEPGILEHRELYTGTVGETSDIVSKEMFIVNALSDLQQNLPFDQLTHTVLRPEGTISCIRALINEGRAQEKLRVFYEGPMFRYNQPQKGRFRQFTQLGCEVLNSSNPFEEAEVIECGFTFLKSIGQEFTLEINAIPSGEGMAQYKKTLKEFFAENADCLSELSKSRANPMRTLDQLSQGEIAALPPIPKSSDFLLPGDLEHFNLVCRALRQLNVDFIIDQHIVRGLDYYKNTVFEFTANNQGIGGGGSYVCEKFKLPISGIGWALGMERFDVSKLVLGKELWVVVAALEPMYGLEVANKLRSKGRKVSIVYNNLQQAVKLANELCAEYVYFCGSDEANRRVVKVKDWGKRSEEIVSFDAI